MHFQYVFQIYINLHLIMQNFFQIFTDKKYYF